MGIEPSTARLPLVLKTLPHPSLHSAGVGWVPRRGLRLDEVQRHFHRVLLGAVREDRLQLVPEALGVRLPGSLGGGTGDLDLQDALVRVDADLVAGGASPLGEALAGREGAVVNEGNDCALGVRHVLLLV